jgi:protein SCO1/2
MNAKIAKASLGLRTLLVLLMSIAVNLEGGPAWAAPSGSPWGANYFPNIELLTQDGEKVHFYDDLIKDKVFAINFIYTRCTASCPLETAALRNLQKALGDSMGKDVVFYSISIDGDTDNPAELKQYAARFHVGPGWTFLTGRPEDVTLLRQKLGMYRDDGQAEQSLSEHGISILMGNERAGQWIKRSPFEETKALVRVLTSRLQNDAPKHGGRLAQLESRVPAQNKGETLFRSNCEACHSTGNQDGIGPGLSGVLARRDRSWLQRWIKAPDKMIVDQDPIALALYRQYNKVSMPNYNLSDVEVESLLSYLAEDGQVKSAD